MGRRGSIANPRDVQALLADIDLNGEETVNADPDDAVAAKENIEQEYLHRGVATRTFARGFNLSDDVRVGEVKFKDGMLTVPLERVIPDHQKLQVFDIN